MNKILKDEHGFLMLNVVFLTMITAFAAMILINAAQRASNPQSTLRLTALYLANEQLAQLESLAAAGEELSTDSHVKAEDLTTDNFGSEEVPTRFEVTTTIATNGDLREVKVIISWTVKGREESVEVERTILIAKENS